jgi:ACS family hexuronate transporter-like MFS transporter
MMLMSVLSYVDRGALAQLAPTILPEVGLSVAGYSLIVSAFSVAYSLANPVWGRVIARVGVRLGAAVAVVLWTLASASHALAAGFMGFATARVVLGLGEGATFPAGARTAAQTLDAQERGRGVAVAYGGASIGSIITPLVVNGIAIRWGWRRAFLTTGALGVAWLGLWLLVSRRRELGAAVDVQRVRPPSPAPRSLVGFAVVYSLGALPIGLVNYFGALHIGRGLGYGQATLGHVLWLPPLGWELGYFCWGWALDRSRGPERFARILGWLAVLIVPFAAAPFVRSLWVVVALMFWGMFVAAGFVIVSLSEVTHRHPAEHAGYLAGVGAGSWSAFMVVASPVFGWLFDRGAYVAAYAFATASPAVGWFVWNALRTDRARA